MKTLLRKTLATMMTVVLSSTLLGASAPVSETTASSAVLMEEITAQTTSEVQVYTSAAQAEEEPITTKNKYDLLPEKDFNEMFYNELMNASDQNGDKKLSYFEVENRRRLGINGENTLYSIKGIKYLVSLQELDLQEHKLIETDEISQLTKLEELTLKDCQLTSLPDMSKLENLKHVDLTGNYLSYDEIRSKLPTTIDDATCLSIAQTQSYYYQELNFNGIVLTGIMMPGTTFIANEIEKGSYEISVTDAVGYNYPESPRLVFPLPANADNIQVFYNDIELTDKISVTDAVYVPFSGNGIYKIVSAEEATTEEPTTEEPTAEVTTTEASTEVITATAVDNSQNPSTGDINNVMPYALASLIATAAMFIALFGKRKVTDN